MMRQPPNMAQPGAAPSPKTQIRFAPLSAGDVAKRDPVSSRATSSLRAGWRWIVRLNHRIDDSWLGDVLGAVSLFALMLLGLIAAGVMQ